MFHRQARWLLLTMGKKSNIAWQFLVRDGNWGGGGDSVLELYSLGSSHGPDKDGSFFVLLHRNEWRWLILANRFMVYQTWCRCYQSSGNYDWIIFESEKIERLIKIKKIETKKNENKSFQDSLLFGSLSKF